MTTPGRLTRALAVSLLLSPSAGCYAYRRVDLADVRPGQQVRARVTPEAAAHLVPLLGRNSPVLQGSVLVNTSDAVMLLVPVAVQSVGAAGLQTINQRVSVPTPDFIEVELKRLDRTRTALLVGAGVAAAGVFVASQFNRSDESPAAPGPRARRVLPLRFELLLPGGP